NWGRGLKVLDANEIEFAERGRTWRWRVSENKLTKVGEIAEQRGDRRGGYWGARSSDDKGDPVESPDKVYAAYIKNNNVYVRTKDDANSEKQLTFDGSPGEYYSADIKWSGDSKKLAVSKVRRAEVRQLTLLESSPADQLQPKLQTRDYVKPADALPQRYPAIIDVESGNLRAVDPKQVDKQFALTYIAWRPDNSGITFEFNQRGHQRYDVLELDAATGETKAIISETSSTFIDYSGKKYRKDLEKTDEVVWASERDGWNHLYLFDSRSGKLKNQITKGNWVVRRVVHVNEEDRTV